MPGIPCGIWDNPDHYDEQGYPIPSVLAYNVRGEVESIPMPMDLQGYPKVDNNGELILPEGYRIEKRDAGSL